MSIAGHKPYGLNVAVFLKLSHTQKNEWTIKKEGSFDLDVVFFAHEQRYDVHHDFIVTCNLFVSVITKLNYSWIRSGYDVRMYMIWSLCEGFSLKKTRALAQHVSLSTGARRRTALNSPQQPPRSFQNGGAGARHDHTYMLDVHPGRCWHSPVWPTLAAAMVPAGKCHVERGADAPCEWSPNVANHALLYVGSFSQSATSRSALCRLKVMKLLCSSVFVVSVERVQGVVAAS